MAFAFAELLASLGPNPSTDALLEGFLNWADQNHLSLYPAQESAILELLEDHHVILNTPTGSGKSLVAHALHLHSLSKGRRSVYTCPIKALVNEKWMSLCREFGPENVGLSTGDATVNRDAPILCCTAEILSNMALSQGTNTPILDVVMDEFHYYSDRERGVAWQIPLLTMPHARFLLMSATLGDTSFFEDHLNKLSARPCTTIKSVDRPVPLDFTYSETPLSNALQKLIHDNKAPVYVVHFTQADAARNAQNFTSLELCSKEEKSAIAQAIEGFRFSSPYGPDLKRWLRMGIGLHHAGLLPKYRILVERLAQKGLLKIICGTDTLGVGVNVPIRTVLLTQLCKYSGDKTAILSVRDFHQIAGRAGRKGFDSIGYVVAQAPEHVIENARLTAKSSQSGKKFVKKQAPERGYVPWDKSTFQKLIDSLPEKLQSRFQVNHGMLLHVLARPQNGCRSMRQLIQDCHDSAQDKKKHQARAFQLFRSLVERAIVQIRPDHQLQVNADLQVNFSMDQTLSLYLMDTLPLLDNQDTDYALNLLSLVESILENPDVILRKQLDQVKNEAMAQMKAQGMEYEERMEALEKLEYPKPLRDFIYDTFNAFALEHPWVGTENIKPKSIAREIFEGFHSFSGYIKLYGLERSEGLLLRHLNSVYKVLANTVPTQFKNEAVQDMEDYLGDMLRRVDSSLLEEWERLRNPAYIAKEQEELLPPGAEEALRDITRDPKIFTASIRSRIFTFLALLSRRDFDSALQALVERPDESIILESIPQPTTWTSSRLRDAYDLYLQNHGAFRMDPEGRSARHTHIRPEGDLWLVEQLLQDNQDHNDVSLIFHVDLLTSKGIGAPWMTLMEFETK